MSAWKPTVWGRLTISSSSTLRLTLCIPPQQISPSAARRSPYSSAIVAAWRNVSAIAFVLPFGSFAQSDGLAAESIRTMPYWRTSMSRSFLPIAQALRTCVRKARRSSSFPIADPPPVGGHTGATSEPTTRPFPRILSASRLRSSSVESMLTCGSNRNRSTPSNRLPFDRAAAVRSSIVSRSIGGSAPGPPLPTRPGHIALWRAGLLCMSLPVRCRDAGIRYAGSAGSHPAFRIPRSVLSPARVRPDCQDRSVSASRADPIRCGSRCGCRQSRQRPSRRARLPSSGRSESSPASRPVTTRRFRSPASGSRRTPRHPLS